MFRRDYEAIRQGLATAYEHSNHPKMPLETLPCIKYLQLMLFLVLMIDNLLHSNFVVPEPLIVKYFPIFLGDIPFEHRSEAQVR